MTTRLPILAAGVAILFLSSGKGRRRSHITFDADNVIGDPLAVDSNDIAFSPNLEKYKVGFGYRVNVLDPWLDQRRRDGRLATIDHAAGKLYKLFIEDPTTWLGDITGTGKVGGSVIYGALWLMATAGIGIYAAGFASTGSSIQAAIHATSTTRAMKILGPRATAIAGELYQKGLSSSRIALALMNFGGAESLAKYGVGTAIHNLSSGAAGLGATLTAGILGELGISAIFSPDIAASAAEAAADFSISHSVLIAGTPVPIALLPSSYPAVQEFNKWLMEYIIRFQKLRFED